MAKGFYISKAVGVLAILLGLAAVSVIIALSVVYSQEKNKNDKSTTAAPTGSTTTAAPTGSTTMAAITLDQSKPWNHYRLPKTLIPDSYNVVLRPYLTPNDKGLYIFKGNSTVRFTCVEATDVIIIHSKKLNYTTVGGHRVVLKAVGSSQVAPDIDRTELVEITEYLVVHLRGQLVAGGVYELFSEFEGELADDLAGFYRSEYMEGNVKK